MVEAGAEVVITDRNQARVQQLVDEFGVTACSEEAIFDQDVDLFAPCALGAILNDDTIPRLKCKIVAGATNNPLLEPRHGQALPDAGILYAPDYVINAGGIINVSVEFVDGGYDEDEAIRRIERIPQALKELWTIAKDEGIPTSEAADRLAQNILADAKAAS